MNSALFLPTIFDNERFLIMASVDKSVKQDLLKELMLKNPGHFLIMPFHFISDPYYRFTNHDNAPSGRSILLRRVEMVIFTVRKLGFTKFTFKDLRAIFPTLAGSPKVYAYARRIWDDMHDTKSDTRCKNFVKVSIEEFLTDFTGRELDWFLWLKKLEVSARIGASQGTIMRTPKLNTHIGQFHGRTPGRQRANLKEFLKKLIQKAKHLMNTQVLKMLIRLKWVKPELVGIPDDFEPIDAPAVEKDETLAPDFCPEVSDTPGGKRRIAQTPNDLLSEFLYFSKKGFEPTYLYNPTKVKKKRPKHVIEEPEYDSDDYDDEYD